MGMTNDKAIKWLKTEASYIEENVGNGKEMLEAYDMAIEALEQEPCEDCISRTELLSKIDAERKHLLDLKMDGAEHIVVHHARRIIEDMPPVTPQPKVGEWLEKEIHSDKVGEWQSARCSVCDKYHTTPYMYYFSNYKFCPNCGARMEVEKCR